MEFEHVVADPLGYPCQALVVGCYADQSDGRLLHSWMNCWLGVSALFMRSVSSLAN